VDGLNTLAPPPVSPSFFVEGGNHLDLIAYFNSSYDDPLYGTYTATGAGSLIWLKGTEANSLGWTPTYVASDGGTVKFDVGSYADDARLVSNAGGVIQLYQGSSAGSIEGAGSFQIEGQLYILEDRGSTEVSGVISDLPPSYDIFGYNSGGIGSLLLADFPRSYQFSTIVLTLSGDNTYTGGTTIESGTLQLGNGGASGSILGDVALSSNPEPGFSFQSILAFDRSDTYTFGGTISGNGTVEQIGTGTTILTAVNTYSGGTIIEHGGTLQLGNAQAAGSGTINFGAGGGELAIATGSVLANTIAVSDFVTGDSIDFQAVSYAAGDTMAFLGNGQGTGGTVHIIDAVGATIASFGVDSNLVPSQLSIGDDGSGHLLINPSTASPAQAVIAAVNFTPPSGDLAAGATVRIEVAMSSAVTVDDQAGSPTITLNDGGVATYDAAASNGNLLVFVYTVASTDSSEGALAVNGVILNGAPLSVAELPQTGPQIDAITPAFTAIADTPPGGVLVAGDSVSLTLSTNDPVTVDTTHGAPTLTLNNNSIATYDAAKSTSTSLVFDYQVQPDDIHVASLTATSFNANGAVIQNGAGTAATLSLAGLAQAGPDIEVGPTVIGTLAAPSSGDFEPDQTITILLEMSKIVTVSGTTATLSLSNGGTATLDVADTAALERFGLVAFDYKVAASDYDTSALKIASVDVHGTTIVDSVGNEAVFSGPFSALPNVEVINATLEDSAPCYCPGTLILTPSGQKPVEQLEIGDEVMTMSGTARPIKWIGRRSYGGRFVMGRKDILPVCFKAGSLDDDTPTRDLWISPHHAMYLEGVLIEAKDLVNGVSIMQAEQREKIEYFHIELDGHDVIIAEGSLSESFIDDDSRGMFHNAHEYREIYGDALSAPARYCAPRLDHGCEVEAARAKMRTVVTDHKLALRGHIDVVERYVISGWAQNPDYPEAPVCLDIYAGGQLIGQTLANRYRADLKRAGLGSGRHSFDFTPPRGQDLACVEVRRSLDGAVLKGARDTVKLLA
jgi:autotransporter-associated beta strand protein